MTVRPARRRVLVVAYYFPPMGLSGVQRVAKFVRYLPAHGWDPVVLTVHPGGYFAFDQALLDEIEEAEVPVIRTASWDPTRMFGRAKEVKLPNESRRARLARLSQWVFVPDNKIGWLPPAVTTGWRLAREQPFDAVLSSAPPYTGHLIGTAISRITDTPLVADFRDDWLGNPRHTYPTKLHRHVHARMERWVMKRAARVTAINRYIAASLGERHPASADAIRVIPQGYDAADFQQEIDLARKARMRLLYTGVFYHAQRPDVFLRGLARLIDRRPELRSRVEAVFAGLLPAHTERLIERLHLQNVVRHLGYLDHDETVAQLQQADVLWMTVGRQRGEEQISTGKLFEYVGSRKPVLGLVPPGAAADALRAYGAGLIVDPDDTEGVAAALEQLYRQWEEGRLPAPDDGFVQRHERSRLAEHLADLLDASTRAGAPA